jgi:hypothetical protein
MTNSDWYAEAEGKSAGIPPSSDLFDGELFGDELIDIYSAAVGDGTYSDAQENGKPLPLLHYLLLLHKIHSHDAYNF